MSRSFVGRAAPIATSMTVGGPGAIDWHPKAGTQWKAAGRGFLGSRGMTAQPAGEESLGGRCRDKIERAAQRPWPSVRPVTSRTQMDVALSETGMKTGVPSSTSSPKHASFQSDLTTSTSG
ncbi:hypothetical protein [Agrobacterium tumefaciens]|uniref:hypothetical protein n=1 Tax=Agrobacterium tumefaciens TaxID=358 RepID=UPI002243ADE6|nr:hypothetical protein [Agrobacterium tumefaciens]MCW8060485.1 hypothetical protein [Agrobacterium tumefaciens]MCW8145929.1 hypothetical protein [Agrobacterium tumefaciens]